MKYVVIFSSFSYCSSTEVVHSSGGYRKGRRKIEACKIESPAQMAALKLRSSNCDNDDRLRQVENENW